MYNEPKIKIREELIKLFKNNKFEELIKIIKDNQKIFPNSIFLLNLLGNINNQLRKFDEAEINFKKILSLEPKFADAHYNLGIIYKNINNIEKSVYHYKECIKFNPNKFEAYNNLGNIYLKKQDSKLAIDNYLLCLEINPKYTTALQNFGVCIQNFKFTKQTPIIEKSIINLLDQNNILRPVDIINSVLDYLYLDKEFYEINRDIKYLEKNYLFEDLISCFLNNKIFMKLLKITPITDIKIEKVLRYLRYNILTNISRVRKKENVLEMIEGIASQCFINEYIYPVIPIENENIVKLEKKIKKSLKYKKINEVRLEIVCLAAYRPLHSFSWSKEIETFNEIKNLIIQQISNPKKELSIKKKLISHKIKDAVSLKVSDQYEANPYPRWERIALNRVPSNPVNFFNNLNLKFDYNKIQSWDKINVLVAGCGTGQHAIATATKYKSSYITAIDLSLNSLSYAKRCADELGINNIEFIQMDLLDLANYGKKFNIIESVGVLHHMNDPYIGWKSLKNVLTSGGLMMIGLYSRKARRHIERIQKNINDINIKINNVSLRDYREKIISSNSADNELIFKSPDFYSLSNFRDLLFHVQEHRFTLEKISEYLGKLDLSFCGFENLEIIKLYKKTYKNKKNLYNLETWSQFELDNPRIFAGMYQFWCQNKI